MKKVIFLSIILLVSYIGIGCNKSQEELLQNVPVQIKDFDKRLSDERYNDWWQGVAKNLYIKYQNTYGESGLDEKRYKTLYKKEIIVDWFHFPWKLYIESHPNDVVLYDDSNDRFYHIYTNNIDYNVFTVVQYTGK